MTSNVVTNQHVEHWRQQQAEEGDAEHPGEHRDPHRVTHLGTGTAGKYQRHHAHDEGERGHQDRTQTQAAGFQHCIQRAHALGLFVLGELDDQNRVLARKPHQYDQADLGEDVVVATGNDHPGNGRQQGHRYNQDHRQRQAPAFVLSGQHQERQQHAEREDEQRGVARENLLIGQVGPFVDHAVGQFFTQQFFHGGLRLARAEARCGCAVDLGSNETVVVHHAVGAGGVTDLDEGRQRDHFPQIVAHLELTDLIGILTELLFSLDVDLISAAETVEVVGIQRAQVHLQGVEDIADGHAMRLGLLAVNRGIDLWHVHCVAGEQPGQFRHAAAFGDDVLGFLIKLVVTQVATVFDLQAEAANGAKSLYRRWRENRHVGFLNRRELAVQCTGDGVGREAWVLAFIERLEGDEYHAVVRAVGEAVDRQTREGNRVFHPGLLECQLRHALDHVLGAVQARGVRQLGKCHQVLLVLAWHKTGWRAGEAQPGQNHQPRIDQQRDAAAANDAGDGAHIAVAGFFKESVERAEQPASEYFIEETREAILGCIVSFKQYRGQRRRQGQRVERRDDRRDGNGQCELFIELPGKARNKRCRYEHRAQHQRRGNDRPRHFSHGLVRRLDRFKPQLDVTLDVLDHHNRVVHHDADGQYQAEQRQRVQRETEHVHQSEGADQ